MLRDVEETVAKWSALEEKNFDLNRRKAFEERREESAQGAVGQLHKWTKPVAVWKTTGQARCRKWIGQGVWTDG